MYLQSMYVYQDFADELCICHHALVFSIEHNQQVTSITYVKLKQLDNILSYTKGYKQQILKNKKGLIFYVDLSISCSQVLI